MSLCPRKHTLHAHVQETEFEPEIEQLAPERRKRDQVKSFVKKVGVVLEHGLANGVVEGAEAGVESFLDTGDALSAVLAGLGAGITKGVKTIVNEATGNRLRAKNLAGNEQADEDNTEDEQRWGGRIPISEDEYDEDGDTDLNTDEEEWVTDNGTESESEVVEETEDGKSHVEVIHDHGIEDGICTGSETDTDSEEDEETTDESCDEETESCSD